MPTRPSLENPTEILWEAQGAPLGSFGRTLWKSYGGPRVLPKAQGPLWRILWKSYGGPRVLPKAPH